VGQQCIRRIEFPLQGFIVNTGVNLRMAGAAEQGDAVFDVAAFEVTLVSTIVVTGLWNQVMPSELSDVALAQLATSPTTYRAAIFHALSMAEPSRRACQGRERVRVILIAKQLGACYDEKGL